MRASWVGPCSKPCWVPKKAALFGLMIKTTHFSVGLLKLTFLRPGETLVFRAISSKKAQKSTPFLSSADYSPRRRPQLQPPATFRITVLRSSRQLCAILSPIVRGDTHCNRHCGKRPSEGRAVASCSACKPCLHLRILHRALYRNGFGIAVAVSPDAIWNHSLNDCLHRLKKL